MPSTPVIPQLAGRHLLDETSLSAEERRAVLDLSAALKAERAATRAADRPRRLAGKHVALIFEKTSTRTRCAFEVAVHDEGGSTTYLDPVSSQFGHKESVEDTARVLGRYYDAIEFRGVAQTTVQGLADHAGVPVLNGLTDEWHPTQSLADQLTLREVTGKADADIAHAYLGDARFNTGCSLLVSAAVLGQDVRIVAPPAFQPPQDVVDLAQRFARESGARITLTEDVEAGVRGADAISTDVWVSMGEKTSAWEERIATLRPYQVTADVLRASGNPDVAFLHCLPAFHDLRTTVGREVFDRYGVRELEVTDEVFRSAASAVIDQAENRMHTIKAALLALVADRA